METVTKTPQYELYRNGKKVSGYAPAPLNAWQSLALSRNGECFRAGGEWLWFDENGTEHVLVEAQQTGSC